MIMVLNRNSMTSFTGRYMFSKNHFLRQSSLLIHTVKPLIANTSKEFIKCRILHFLIMEYVADI